ncbi:MAG: hypothetical protein JXQ65_08985 [Candidatus Marinimicrobia bacterium]|nr:hypothetical protein [Candidatus Neomarinimicrobiota bacterium]
MNLSQTAEKMMNKYLILQHPGANSAYYTSSEELALAELQIACNRLQTRSEKIQAEEIADLRYLTFEVETELTESDIKILSRLSFFFALFQQVNSNDPMLLRPIARAPFEFVDEKISSLLKYAGKTNVQFTRMMVNVALLSSDFHYEDRIRLLDPVAGKATTMFEGIIQGFNVFGVEIEHKSVHEATIFFKKYLEREKFIHTFDKHKSGGNQKTEIITQYKFSYAKTREEFDVEETNKKFQMICGNSQNVSDYFKNESMHLIVGDLPYGIAHGNTVGKKFKSVTRNPSELLDLSLPDWYKLLIPGGVIVVAWNSYVVGFDILNEIFKKNGFRVLDAEPYTKFEHLVDKSIRRDIVVAKKGT